MEKRGLQLVFFTAIISGISIFLNNFGVKGIDSTVFTFLKNIIVALFLLAIIIAFKDLKELKQLKRKDWLSLLLIGLVGGSIPFVLFFKGLQLSNGAVGSFIHKTMFVFVAALAFLFLKEKMTKKVIIPAALLLLGNYLLLKIGMFSFDAGSLYILIATLFWSAENIISKKALEELKPNILAFGRMFFGSLFILIYMAFTDKLTLIPSLSFAQLSWVLLSVPLLLLYVLTWYSGLKHVKATTATAILLLGSPITTLLSFVFLGQALTIMQVVGIMLIVAGTISIVLLLERKTQSAFSTA